MQNNNNTSLPANSGIINVKDFGAVGDGVTDDTIAIQNAIKNTPRSNAKHVIIYFPIGTYLISDSIKWLDTTGAYFCYLTLQGESLNNTIIKLADLTPGFSNPTIRKAVLITGSQNPTTDGAGNQAFRNGVYDLTIDTGIGNLGAVGLDYLANNKGSVRNITVKGSGRAGIDMSRSWAGPCYLKNIKIDGFDVGINVNNHYQFGITLEHISLLNQKIAGIYVKNNILSIRGLTSNNTVPAIQTTSVYGSVTLIDGNLTGGSSACYAIESVGHLYVRNVTTTGYLSSVKQKGLSVTGINVNEYSSSEFKSLFGNTNKSLKLIIKDAPEFNEPIENWANVVSFGAKADDNSNDTPYIQAALDSGASTIYFPTGTYNINKTLIVRGHVKKIIGMESFLKPRATYSAPNPSISFETTLNDVIVEKLNIKGVWQHNSHKALVLIDCAYSNYVALPGAGDLYGENVMIGKWQFSPGQKVWLRQLNTEFTNATRLINDGATLWILGIKTEDPYTVIETKNGGQTELVGGLLYPGHGNLVPTSDIAFINNESKTSFIYTVAADGAGQDYTNHVQTIKTEVVKTLTKTSTVGRGHGSVVFYCD